MPEDPYRLLLVANRTCPCPGLPDTVREHAGDPVAEVDGPISATVAA